LALSKKSFAQIQIVSIVHCYKYAYLNSVEEIVTTGGIVFILLTDIRNIFVFINDRINIWFIFSLKRNEQKACPISVQTT